MADLSIRPIDVAEQGRLAARKCVDTGEPQPNPHIGLPGEKAFKAAYERWLVRYSALEDADQASA